MLKHNLRSKLFYNVLAPVYDHIILSTGYRAHLRRFVQGVELPTKELHVLDAGCGTGLVTFALLDKYENIKITAFDYSKDMLMAAEKFQEKENYSNVEFYLGDIESVNPLKNFNGEMKFLEEESFDYIFVSGALEYVDMEKGIRELAKYLKKDGVLINIAVRNNLCGKLIGKLMGFKPYSKEQLLNALKEAKLADIKEVPIIEKRARLCKMAVSGKKLF